jgi:hypothetical protein
VVAGPFELRSAFLPNLHHFLYAQTRAGKGLDRDRPAITRALDDKADLRRLAPEDRAGWERAVAHYAAEVAARDAVFDEVLVEAKARIASCPDGSDAASCGVPAALARALDGAAPAYRALWWPTHDRANRAWMAAVRPLLAAHGDEMKAALARAFGFTWPAEPLPVDVTAYANWAGAYTTRDPDHVTISSRAPAHGGTAAFESLFHEAMHTRDQPLLQALGDAARETGKRTRGLAHPLVFYTAGELTRRLFPNHTPYAEQSGLWTRDPTMARALPLLRAHWQPFLEGHSTFEEALRAVVGGSPSRP